MLVTTFSTFGLNLFILQWQDASNPAGNNRITEWSFVISLSDTAVRHILEDEASLCNKTAVLGDMIIGISTSLQVGGVSNCL